jgi:predicted kinase
MKQHHFLIGPPGSGKTTFADILLEYFPGSAVISTDEIRRQCYGDPSIQGHWPDIFSQVKLQCKQTIAAGKTIIYDATNAKRPWRLSFLRELLTLYSRHAWVGWHLTTPLKTCLEWNRRRDRQVPEDVIAEMDAALNAFPPDPAEGMTIVHSLNPCTIKNLSIRVGTLLGTMPRKVINQRNATKNSKHSFHPYSDLLAFERLLYLLKVLLDYPGVGSLRYSTDPSNPSDPNQPNPPNLSAAQTTLDELELLLSQEHHPIYSDRSALIQNLNWLGQNGFLSTVPDPDAVWILPEQPPPSIATHGYAYRDRFLRLLGTLRFMLHYPFGEGEGGALDTLTQALLDHRIISGHLHSCRDTLRKDIQLILKPYGLLKSNRYKKGYFLGTGIFSHAQLSQLHQLLAGQTKSLADPTTLDLFHTLSDRLQWSKLSPLSPYPVRALYNFSITNHSHLPPESLAKTIDRLEREIEQGQSLELKRFPGVGSHGTEPETFFQAWPVQIVFHNIGWYLGYEMLSGDQKGLLAFERLDRLFRGRSGGPTRHANAQERACEALEQLFRASGGLFLGTNAHDQRQWLQGSPEQCQALSQTLELWCNDEVFRFISEGDQRFPPDQIRLSPRLPDSRRPSDPKIFCLKPTEDPTYPHRFQVQLPYWALQGIDLRRWVWGFQAKVRVVSPVEFVAHLRQAAEAMDRLYNPMPSDG